MVRAQNRGSRIRSSAPARRAGPLRSAWLATALGIGTAPSLPAQGEEIGFAETWALAPDRAAAVARLLPGSNDWYYYHCRERLDAGDFDRVRTMLPAWIEAHGRNGRVLEIENREALLSFPKDPGRTFDFLRGRLGLAWNHTRHAPGQAVDLPHRLDPALLAATTLTEQALARHPGTVDGFHDRALAELAGTTLGDDALRSLLTRLARPDVRNLAALVVRDLAHRNSKGFGSLRIHKELRLADLDECARLRPELLADRAFVDAWLARLDPLPDSDWMADPAAAAARFARIHAFAQRLPAVHHSLQAHVLHHWLAHELTQGAPDRDRFLAYLRLPRDGERIAAAHRRRSDRAETRVDESAGYPTGFPPIRDEWPLIRACLVHFFARESSVEPYSEFLAEPWLRALLAETKLLLGDGDPSRWVALLPDPAQRAALEQRVDIDFAPTQRSAFAPADPVRLVVDVKNVPTLLVKVWSIDTLRWHVERGREVDSSIELDGVIPNFEETHSFSEPPIRRVRRTFDLPQLSGPGTWVVELIGNGRSSRAVIKKGTLRHVERVTVAGHLFHVFDEAARPVLDARIWFGGREYVADAGGALLLPFSTDAGRHTIVLRHGDRSALATFDHRAEEYALNAAFHVERDALTAGATARLLVRPQLRVAGQPAAIALLDAPALEILAKDGAGVVTVEQVRGLELADDRERVHEFRVPERLAGLSVRLTGTVKDLAGREVRLSSPSVEFAINAIDATPATNAPQLVGTPTGHFVELRGKDGEPKAGRAVALSLFHRDYRDPVEVTLATDGAGRIELGPLAGIESVRVRVEGAFEGVIPLARPQVELPPVVHGRAGEVVRLPYVTRAKEPTRAEFTLLGHERDESARLALNDGFLELRELAAGDYTLWLHDRGQRVAVSITAGPRAGDWLHGSVRRLEASPERPLALRSISAGGDELAIALANVTPETRVHLFSSRHLPPFDPFQGLAGWRPTEAAALDSEPIEAEFMSGRVLGDEYRYVLDRRFQPKFAGNLLRRPTLLLNPWAVDDESENDSIGAGSGSGGAKYDRRGRARGGGRADSRGHGGIGGPHPGAFANLDWLVDGSVTLPNLKPGADGVVRVPRALLRDGPRVQFVAIDGGSLIGDTLFLPERPVTPRTRRLAAAFSAERTFLEQRTIEAVAAGGTAELGDPRSAKAVRLDSLAAVHQLLSALSGDADLERFAFLLEWPTLTPERKRELLGQHACHELHFFLHRRDPAFFAEVIRPYLANKHAPTFLDRWLLGADLSAYADPWTFAQLNLIEQILLAQRQGGESRAIVARRLREQLELMPPDHSRREQLFEQALRLGELRPSTPMTGAPAPSMGGEMAPPGAPAEKAEAKKLADGAPSKDSKLREELADAEETDDEAAAEPSRASADAPFEGREALKAELERRGRARQLYRAVAPTEILAEHDYHHRTRAQTTPDMVAPNRFWLDYATSPAGQPFVSAAIGETTGSFLEMLFALSLIDLPFTPGAHEITSADERQTLRAAAPLLLVRREIRPAERATDRPPLLLGENFFRLDERFRMEGGQKRDAFLTGEFLVDVAYGCEVVVTNPTSTPRVVELLLQVPAGALPVQGGMLTRGFAQELDAYATRAIQYAFYFPAAGEFAHYPAQVGEGGRMVAAAAPRTLTVVPAATTVDTTSFEHVSQHGTTAELLAWLDSHPLEGLDLARIAWRLRERTTFEAVLGRLRPRHRFDATVWSYGLFHRDATATREYLERADGFVGTCGRVLESPLLSIDPLARGTFEQLEFEPLVHARAHPLGGRHRIANADLAAQYGAFLDVLGYRTHLADRDWLAVAWHLLLQDRIEEGLAAFGRVDRAKVHEQLQYDYLAAFGSFFTGDVAKARALATARQDHPVPHWRARFREVLAQLDEVDSAGPAARDATDAGALAATEPVLELALEGRRVVVQHANLAACEVRCYELDVEFAFSAQPFSATDGDAIAPFVQPTLRESLTLPAGGAAASFELPERLAARNVLVELRGGGLVRTRPRFANALQVRLLETIGQLAVSASDGGAPLPKTYVKVYAKLPDGTVRFHKDGYTDLRGRFDYASLSDDPDASAERYAILVLHEQHGAVLREVAPPAR